MNPSRSNDQHGSRIGNKTQPAQKALVPRGRTRPERAKPQSSRYEELKATVRIWIEDRFKIADALKEIHDDKLYKDEYGSFEDFCHDEYGISKSNAYRLIKAAGVVASVRPSQVGTLISNETQAAALATVPKPKRAAVLRRARKAGRVTARSIRAAAAQSVAPAASDVIDVTPEPAAAVPVSETVEPVAVKHCATCTCAA